MICDWIEHCMCDQGQESESQAKVEQL